MSGSGCLLHFRKSYCALVQGWVGDDGDLSALTVAPWLRVRFEVGVLQNVLYHRNILGIVGLCMRFPYDGQSITDGTGKSSVAVVVPLKAGGTLKDFLKRGGIRAAFL